MSFKNKYFPLLPLVLLSGSALLGACSPLGLATGAGATVGIAAAQEGGLNAAYKDTKIRAEINELWFSHDVEMFRKVDMTVNQGRVLLTGVVQNPEHRVEAVRLAWQPEDVVQVINEIKVADSSGIIGFTRDTWITTRLRTAITLDSKVQSINYSIDTVQGTVYLMGVARNQTELNHVIEKARTIPDVRRVVSYVKFAGERMQRPAVPGSAEMDQAPAAYDDPNKAYTDPYNEPAYDTAPAYETQTQTRTQTGSVEVQRVESEELLAADPAQ